MKVRVKSTNRSKEDEGFLVGDVFKVIEIRDNSFDIISPVTNKQIYCLFERCAHLNGGDWEVVKPTFWERVVSFFRF